MRPSRCISELFPVEIHKKKKNATQGLNSWQNPSMLTDLEPSIQFIINYSEEGIARWIVGLWKVVFNHLQSWFSHQMSAADSWLCFRWLSGYRWKFYFMKYWQQQWARVSPGSMCQRNAWKIRASHTSKQEEEFPGMGWTFLKLCHFRPIGLQCSFLIPQRSPETCPRSVFVEALPWSELPWLSMCL
jgi:hypothetical protein